MEAQPIREKIQNPDFFLISISTCLTHDLTEFRTGPRAKHPKGIGQPEPMACWETAGRRVLAEVGYLVLVIASLIEVFIRVIIGAIIAPFAWRMDEDNEFRNKAIQLCLHGTIYTLENYFITMAALVQNVTDSNMCYDSIVPCILENNKYLVLSGVLES